MSKHQPYGLISKSAAARRIGCSVRLLDALVCEGRGPLAYEMWGRLRFDPADIDEWLASIRVGTPPAPAPQPIEGAGTAGFLLAHGLACALKGMGWTTL